MDARIQELQALYAPLSFEGIPEDLLDALPLEKDDQLRVERVKSLGYPRVRPIIPHLLTWMSDINWPVAGHLVPFFRRIRGEITDEIRAVLRGSDLTQIYWVLEYLVDDPDLQLAESLRSELVTLANGQDEEEVHIKAAEILAALERK